MTAPSILHSLVSVLLVLSPVGTQRLPVHAMPSGPAVSGTTTSGLRSTGRCHDWSDVPRYSMHIPAQCETAGNRSVIANRVVIPEACVTSAGRVLPLGGRHATAEHYASRYNISHCTTDVVCYERTRVFCGADAPSVCDSGNTTETALARVANGTINCDELEFIERWVNGEGGDGPDRMCTRRLGSFVGEFDLTSPGCDTPERYESDCMSNAWFAWGEFTTENVIAQNMASVSSDDKHFHFHWHGVMGVEWSPNLLNNDGLDVVACGYSTKQTHWYRVHVDDEEGEHGYPTGIDDDFPINPYICSADKPSGSDRPQIHVKGMAMGVFCWESTNFVRAGDSTSDNEWDCDDFGTDGCCWSEHSFALLNIWFREEWFYSVGDGDPIDRTICDCGTVEWSN